MPLKASMFMRNPKNQIINLREPCDTLSPTTSYLLCHGNDSGGLCLRMFDELKSRARSVPVGGMVRAQPLFVLSASSQFFL